MKLGEIYIWNTDKVIGHEARNKYHIFICCGDWETDNVFLFINKNGNAWDCEISNKESCFSFLPLERSYIDCGSIVTYSDEYIAAAKPEYKGRINAEAARRLLACVDASDVMPGRHRKRICEHLQKSLQVTAANNPSTGG